VFRDGAVAARMGLLFISAWTDAKTRKALLEKWCRPTVSETGLKRRRSLLIGWLQKDSGWSGRWLLRRREMTPRGRCVYFVHRHRRLPRNNLKPYPAPLQKVRADAVLAPHKQ